MKPGVYQVEYGHVLTGGPGSGKSTLLTALAAEGYSCMPESGRRVIQDEVASGGRALPWLDPAAFAERMLDHDLETYQAAARLRGPVFFDRGIPDVIGYLQLGGLTVPDRIATAAREWRYDRTVFIAPPWPAIYVHDAERKQDLAEAARTHEAMVQTYTSLGYRLVELPRATVEERLRFVLTYLATHHECGAAR